MFRGGGTGEATASLEFRGFTIEKFLASWIYERGNFLCFTGKKLIPTPLLIRFYSSLINTREIRIVNNLYKDMILLSRKKTLV